MTGNASTSTDSKLTVVTGGGVRAPVTPKRLEEKYNLFIFCGRQAEESIKHRKCMRGRQGAATLLTPSCAELSLRSFYAEL